MGSNLDLRFVAPYAGAWIETNPKSRLDPILSKNHTMQEVLDEFDLIECFEVPGQRLQVGEIIKRQIELYTQMGVDPPPRYNRSGI